LNLSNLTSVQTRHSYGFSEMKFGFWRYFGLAGIVTLSYFLAAELGLSLASVHTNVSPVWPPTGIAIAALLIFGRRLWPAILIGAFFANLWTQVSTPVALGIAIGNTLEAVAAAYLLTFRATFDHSFSSIRSVLKFILFAVVVSPMISATIGNISLCSGGEARWADFASLWLTWWLGDGFGALIVAPFLLAWDVNLKRRVSPKAVIEALLLLAALLLVSLIAFAGWIPGADKRYPIAHLTLPFLVWAALRLDQRTVTAATLLLSAVAVWGTTQGYGSFVRGGPNESLLLLQLFIGSTALLTYVLYAVMHERTTAQKDKFHLAAEVAQQRKRVEDIVAHVPGVVWEAWGEPDAATQRIDFVSDYVEKMLGYSVEEWLSTPNFWRTIVHEDDREAAGRAAARTFAAGTGGVNRFRWLTKDGREIWVESQSVVVCDETGKPVAMRGVTMDITETVRAQEERTKLLESEREARAQAEQASRLKDEFLATISHELRTPLNAIVGWARLLRSGQLDPENLEHAFEVIERNAWSQKQIIEDMLDVSRIITGKLRIGLVPLELMSVIQTALDVVRPAAEAKEIELKTQFETPELLVSGDAERLQQVIWNLLSNAVKFTPNRGAVEIVVKRENGAAEIAVWDDGPGIPPDFLPHVFERFSQADSSSTRRHGGLGLGLAITRHLVELHGGAVKAENREDGKGAVLTVTLPAYGNVPEAG
jgi:PAS domain S-box-containing protein